MNDQYQPSEGEPDLSAATDAVGECDLYEEEEDLSAKSAAVGDRKSCRLDRKLLYQEFDRLFLQIYQENSDIWKRKRLLSQLIIKMKNSGLIWKDNVPYYEDALQEQWEFFCSNLWESRTGTQYDRTRGNVMTWFNSYLKWRLLNFRQKFQKEQEKTAPSQLILEEGEPIELLETIPAPDRTDIAETVQLFAEIENWIETNPDGVLNEFIRGRPDLTCQVILRRYLSEPSFTVLAKEFSCPYNTLYGFYRKKCNPKLREFRDRSAS